MIDYRAGNWGLHTAFTHCCDGSLVPKALTMAIPNALLTCLIATLLQQSGADEFDAGVITMFHKDTAGAAAMTLAAFTAVMSFILQRRSSIAYDRWWEGGTLLQKTRGEWFNAYSSVMAFTSTKPEMQDQVEEYQQLLARLMSLLMCCGLQQVSPNRERSLEILDLDGFAPDCMEFLNSAPDKVEIILQWIQRSIVLHAQSGVLPVAPPILSRAFQEFSRGIVNLQNARKIADFPYPYPLAQISMILQMLHWAMTPIAAALAVPRGWAVLLSFLSIFGLWCIHFNAIELEFPFGSRTNDLPMTQFQFEWNESVCALLDKRVSRPPVFAYNPRKHANLDLAMSDESRQYVPTRPIEIALTDPESHLTPPDSIQHKGFAIFSFGEGRRRISINCYLSGELEGDVNERRKCTKSPDGGSAGNSTTVQREVAPITLQVDKIAAPTGSIANDAMQLGVNVARRSPDVGTAGRSETLQKEVAPTQLQVENTIAPTGSIAGDAMQLDANAARREEKPMMPLSQLE
eukprot:TRINITY_DN14165_c0_g4_i1.p1 TRINITY_DN14165_c0_g4~~TRINITY_DN14165_c0_g4_i1.p1  ORF type:complete len:518 (-),score=69.88 TRINITY_DN14165_c0_g4_i1:85-1638(-)